MRETWRWYGATDDPIKLDEIRETGVQGVVTSLYHVDPDTAWNVKDVQSLKAKIEAADLTWDVVESIPVPNSVKLGNSARDAGIETFSNSLRAVARAGIPMVCYNFMPTFDWTRTSISWSTRTGLATRFDYVGFAVYDLFLLKRPGASEDYSEEVIAAAERGFKTSSPEMLDALESVIVTGLPSYLNIKSPEDVLRQIALFEGMGREDIAANLSYFLQAVGPLADELGVNLGIHPDDPPFPVFGLPRIVSNGDDLQRLLDAHDSPRNGLTFCTGSLGASPTNDTLALFERFASRVNFLHLRNVTIDGERSFFEDEHLVGQTDMVALSRAILREERRREAEGRADAIIPMRPDHGQLNQRDADLGSPHGYSYIGRLKGLAELRGVAKALEAQLG
ncbi:MAG: mannonate dehydratase [Pseudomonadota bacterium]